MFGLEAGEVKVPDKDGEIPAYRALPFRGTSFSTVLVVEEVFGVHEHIKDICRRLAKAGYFAIAPELYARLGNVVKMTSIDEILSTVDRAPDTQMMRDLDATVAYAKTTQKANTAKLAITGFCSGGRTVRMYAAHNPISRPRWRGTVLLRVSLPKPCPRIRSTSSRNSRLRCSVSTRAKTGAFRRIKSRRCERR